MRFDFNDIMATSKDEKVRAWCIGQALEAVSDASISDVVAVADVIQKYIVNGKQDEDHNDNTLLKVHEALAQAGVLDTVDAVGEMQNAGILFRERV